jgi:hypothetical protein
MGEVAMMPDRYERGGVRPPPEVGDGGARAHHREPNWAADTATCRSATGGEAQSWRSEGATRTSKGGEQHSPCHSCDADHSESSRLLDEACGHERRHGTASARAAIPVEGGSPRRADRSPVPWQRRHSPTVSRRSFPKSLLAVAALTR